MEYALWADKSKLWLPLGEEPVPQAEVVVFLRQMQRRTASLPKAVAVEEFDRWALCIRSLAQNPAVALSSGELLLQAVLGLMLKLRSDRVQEPELKQRCILCEKWCASFVRSLTGVSAREPSELDTLLTMLRVDSEATSILQLCTTADALHRTLHLIELDVSSPLMLPSTAAGVARLVTPLLPSARVLPLVHELCRRTQLPADFVHGLTAHHLSGAEPRIGADMVSLVWRSHSGLLQKLLPQLLHTLHGLPFYAACCAVGSATVDIFSDQVAAAAEEADPVTKQQRQSPGTTALAVDGVDRAVDSLVQVCAADEAVHEALRNLLWRLVDDGASLAPLALLRRLHQRLAPPLFFALAGRQASPMRWPSRLQPLLAALALPRRASSLPLLHAALRQSLDAGSGAAASNYVREGAWRMLGEAAGWWHCAALAVVSASPDDPNALRSADAGATLLAWILEPQDIEQAEGQRRSLVAFAKAVAARAPASCSRDAARDIVVEIDLERNAEVEAYCRGDGSRADGDFNGNGDFSTPLALSLRFAATVVAKDPAVWLASAVSASRRKWRADDEESGDARVMEWLLALWQFGTFVPAEDSRQGHPPLGDGLLTAVLEQVVELVVRQSSSSTKSAYDVSRVLRRMLASLPRNGCADRIHSEALKQAHECCENAEQSTIYGN